MRKSLINSPIATYNPVIGILRINPYYVIVYVFMGFPSRFKRLPGILRMVHVGIHYKDFLFI